MKNAKEMTTKSGKRIVCIGDYGDGRGLMIKFREDLNIMQRQLPQRGALKPQVVDSFFATLIGIRYVFNIYNEDIAYLVPSCDDKLFVTLADIDLMEPCLATSGPNTEWNHHAHSEEELLTWLADN